jgi:hypothetical protein
MLKNSFRQSLRLSVVSIIPLLFGCLVRGEEIARESRSGPSSMSLNEAHDFHRLLCSVVSAIEEVKDGKVVIDGFPRRLQTKGIEKLEIIGRWTIVFDRKRDKSDDRESNLRVVAIEIVHLTGETAGTDARSKDSVAWRGHRFSVTTPGDLPEGILIRKQLLRELHRIPEPAGKPSRK